MKSSTNPPLAVVLVPTLLLLLSGLGCQGVSSSGSSSSPSITISPSTARLQAGLSLQFTATVKGTSNTAVTWSVNGVVGGNNAIGTISSSGLYTAPTIASASNVNVTASSHADTAQSATAVVAVEPSSNQTTVTISPAKVTLQVGSSQQFTATVNGSSSNDVTWSVNGTAGGNPTVGTISTTGLYTAPPTVPAIAVTVSASSTANSNDLASATVSIESAQGGVSITISPTSASLQVGLSQQFSATVKGSSNTGVTWMVNGVAGGNSAVGTISSAGLYTAPQNVPSSGQVTVEARSNADSTKSATASLTILSTVTVKLSPASATVYGAETQQFTATVLGTSNTGVTWSVDGIPGGNATAGTISSSGVYTAPACPSAGSETIEATSVYDGASSNATVTISPGGSGTGHYYVATTGSNSNIGSGCHPWATIGHATSVVNPADTVIVEDGTYAENVYFTRSGTAMAPIIFRSQHKWGAVIVGPGSSNLNYFSHADYVTIQDFEMVGNPNDASIIKIDVGQHDSIIGNKIHGSGVNATQCNSGAAVSVADDYANVSGNLIYNNGPLRSASFRCNQHHGLYVTKGNSGVIQNNIIFESWQGVGLHINSEGFSNWIVTNNTFFNNGDSVHDSGGPFIFVCLGSGIVCDYNTFNNNILVNNERYGFYEDEPDSTGTIGTHNTYDNNVLFDNPLGNVWWTGKDVATVSSDPLFVDYTGNETGNYHLQSTSPAIGTGTAVGAPSTDFDGFPRPYNGKYDIGAYEWHP